MEAFFSHTFTDLLKLRRRKASEYSDPDDALSNFRKNATEIGVEMETIWRIYARKHFDAVMLYLRDLQVGSTRVRSEPVEGRIDDLLVYLILLRAMLRERQDGERQRAEEAVPGEPSDGGLSGGGDALHRPRGA
jgi:hypothetical protein